jgi:hypothetical protein
MENLFNHIFDHFVYMLNVLFLSIYEIYFLSINRPHLKTKIKHVLFFLIIMWLCQDYFLHYLTCIVHSWVGVLMVLWGKGWESSLCYLLVFGFIYFTDSDFNRLDI